MEVAFQAQPKRNHCETWLRRLMAFSENLAGWSGEKNVVAQLHSAWKTTSCARLSRQ